MNGKNGTKEPHSSRHARCKPGTAKGPDDELHPILPAKKAFAERKETKRTIPQLAGITRFPGEVQRHTKDLFSGDQQPQRRPSIFLQPRTNTPKCQSQRLAKPT